MSTKHYLTGCLAIAFLASSCKKNASYDVKGDEKVKFFTNSETAGNAVPNSKTFSVVNYPNTAGSGWLTLSTSAPAEIKFPVFATRPVSKDVIVYAQLDNSLVTKYNAANNTNYQPLPPNILGADPWMAHVLKGTTISADSISISVNASLLNTLSANTYMVPVKLVSVSDQSVGAITSAETQTTFLVFNVEQRQIKYLAVAADAIGTLITPRTSWTVLFNPTPTTTGSIIDGSLTTFSRWSASPGQLDVNLQATRNVTGIRLYTANSATYVPTQVDVYLSEDGVNYNLIGSPLKANLTYASSYNYILFYKPIPARYIRLGLSYVTNTNSQNYRVVEFDVYAN